MFTTNSRRCSMVSLLVGEFNDIIEWKAQIVQNELDYQAQRAQNFENYERRYSLSSDCGPLVPLQRSRTDSSITTEHERSQHLEKEQEQKQIRFRREQELIKQHQEREKSPSRTATSSPSSIRKPRIIRIKRSKTQKCFSQEFNRLRNEAIWNKIDEHSEQNEQDKLDCCPIKVLVEPEPFKEWIKIDDIFNGMISIVLSICQYRTSIGIEDYVVPLPLEAQSIEPNVVTEVTINQDLIEEIEFSIGKEEIEPEPKPVEEIQVVEETEIEAVKEEPLVEESLPDPAPPQPPPPPPPPKPKVMTRHNVLLEKLSNSYRHQFEVKTAVHQNGGGTNRNSSFSRKDSSRFCTHCFCGEEFKFSEKYLRCLNCWTGCHTSCAERLPKPCIRYVDPFLKPSKLITNYVYPRSKPLIPALLLNCCREIEVKCQKDFDQPQNRRKRDSTYGLTDSSFELYYIQSEMLKPVKEQCKKLLHEYRFGFRRLDDLNLDQLCGIIKYFLSEVIEPLFPKNSWKEYSSNIQKRNEQELAQSLKETFKQLNQANLHTLCFILVHLKHLIRCGFQDQDILMDIFCPIIMGDLESKRKLRLMKSMFQIDDNILVSYLDL